MANEKARLEVVRICGTAVRSSFEGRAGTIGGRFFHRPAARRTSERSGPRLACERRRSSHPRGELVAYFTSSI